MKPAVLDASAWINILLGLADGHVLRGRDVLVPPHFDVEVVSTLRKLLFAGRIDAADLDNAVEDHKGFPFDRVAFNDADLRRCLALRDRMAVADAWYVAVAERSGAAWITDDERAARTAELLGADVERQRRP